MNASDIIAAKHRAQRCEAVARTIGKRHDIKFRRKSFGGVNGHLPDGQIVNFSGWVEAYNWITYTTGEYE